MTDYQDLVKRLREYFELRELRTCAEAADALEHMALSHDAMVQEIETLRAERDEALRRAENKDFEATSSELKADALRALLREAGKALEPITGDTYWDTPDKAKARDVLARIKDASAVKGYLA